MSWRPLSIVNTDINTVHCSVQIYKYVKYRKYVLSHSQVIQIRETQTTCHSGGVNKDLK